MFIYSVHNNTLHTDVQAYSI